MGTKFKYSKQRALFFAIVTAILSFIALVISARMSPGVPTTTLTNVASAFLTLGIVGVVYETFLRESVTNETLEIVNLERTVADTRLRKIVPATSVDWADLAEDATKAQILISNPIGWIEREWANVLDIVRSREAHITIFLPNSAGPNIDEIARRHGYDKDQFRTQVKSARQYLEDSWTGNKVAGFRRGSTISLKVYDGVAGNDMAAFDSCSALFVNQSVGRQPGESSLAFIFKSGGGHPGHWIVSQLDQLDKDLGEAWADKVD